MSRPGSGASTASSRGPSRPGSAKLQLHPGSGALPRPGSRPGSAGGLLGPLLPPVGGGGGARGRPSSAGHQSLRPGSGPASPASLGWASALRGAAPVALSRPRTAPSRRRNKPAVGDTSAALLGRLQSSEVVARPRITPRPLSAGGLELGSPASIAEDSAFFTGVTAADAEAARGDAEADAARQRRLKALLAEREEANALALAAKVAERLDAEAYLQDMLWQLALGPALEEGMKRQAAAELAAAEADAVAERLRLQLLAMKCQELVLSELVGEILHDFVAGDAAAVEAQIVALAARESSAVSVQACYRGHVVRSAARREAAEQAYEEAEERRLQEFTQLAEEVRSPLY